MAHIHSVYDGDSHFEINPLTRQIKNTSGKVVLMQNDHNSERFTFEIPRFNGLDGHDMSQCNVVEVHYINIDAKDKSMQTNGVYPVGDLQLSPNSDDVVICSWLISQNATKYAGTLNFVLRFACLTGENIDYQWFTDIHKGISVSESISNGEAVVEEYADVLERWRQELMNGTGGTYAIKYVESLDENNLVSLRDLESDLYMLYGYFKPFPGSDSTLIIDKGYYMVARVEEGSHLLSISPLNFRMTCHEILVDDTNEKGFTYTNTRINLLEVLTDKNEIVNSVIEELPKWTGGNY